MLYHIEFLSLLLLVAQWTKGGDGSKNVCGIGRGVNSPRPSRSVGNTLKMRTPRRTDNDPIVGGVDAEPLSWPWMVALDKHVFGLKYRHLCGATLISRRHVLTAAHCFQTNDTESPSKFTVRLEAHERDSGTRYGVKEIIVYHRYQSSSHYHDLAILVLSTDVPGTSVASPICLPSANDSPEKYEGRDAMILGWGDTSFGGPPSKVLQQAVVPVVSTASCDEIYSNLNRERFADGITRRMLCAGYDSGVRDACLGDSGGPLQILDSGVWKQIGVMSFGYRCGTPGIPGVYARVSAYVPWINSILDEDIGS